MESVIANRAGRAHRFFDIAGFDNAFDTVGITGPNAGQKICLQLEADRELIIFRFTDPTAHRLHTIGYTEQILHVMSDFVGYHVGLCEIASCPQGFLEQTVKTEVDINASIVRAIERTARATGEPAAGPSLVREEYELRLLVLPAHLPEDLMPGVFGIGENDSDELRCLIVRPLAVDLLRLR